MRVCKCSSVDAFPIDMQDSRKPDVGIGIRVELSAATHHDTQEYHGEYIGHGQSKTVFLLRRLRTHRAVATEHAAEYHGKVLKLAKERNIEPEVLRQALPLDVMTRILYEAEAVDNESGQRYFCWITDRCIPLNQLFKLNHIDKSCCSLGAYFCMLRAARWNVYVSDCGLQNFGLVVNDRLNMHEIAIIDAGQWQCQDSAWSKSKVNRNVMRKFWDHCEKLGAEIQHLKRQWQQCATMADALQQAAIKWTQIDHSRQTREWIVIQLLWL